MLHGISRTSHNKRSMASMELKLHNLMSATISVQTSFFYPITFRCMMPLIPFLRLVILWPIHRRRLCLTTTDSSSNPARRKECWVWLYVALLQHWSLVSLEPRQIGCQWSAFTTIQCWPDTYAIYGFLRDSVLQDRIGSIFLNLPNAALTVVVVAASHPPPAEMVSQDRRRSPQLLDCSHPVINVITSSAIKRTNSSKISPKLNPLQAKWPMERALISRFCSVNRMRVFDSPWMGH